MVRKRQHLRATDDPLAHLKLPFPLRNYQKQGVRFFFQRTAALLADEMGLGKTVQTILATRLLRQADPCLRVLVVTPRSLCRNWQNEFHTWAPELLVRVVEGSADNRKALYHLPIPVLIATYEQMRLDTDLLDRDTAFDVVILDEAQRIKNQGSGASVACRGIPRQRSWALTGTPLENRPDDIISLFSFVQRSLLFRGISIGALHERIKPFFLRRTKKDVLPELPPILIQDLTLQLRGQQRLTYDALWQTRLRVDRRGGSAAGRPQLLALITKLKTLCNFDPVSDESSKLEALQLILENLGTSDDKILIFSQYVKTLEWLSERIKPLPHKIFHGGLTANNREKTLDWFRQSKGPTALLMSLMAGGVGLNLQEASVVVMFDRWWNPAIESQAIQRAHRFGRKGPLHVFRFLVGDTVEERINTVLVDKRLLFTEYVEGAASAELPTLPNIDLRRILDLPGAPHRKARP
jgi:SNF2 family DNA or RNA helicase